MAVTLALSDAEALLGMLAGYGAGKSSPAAILASAVNSARSGGPISGVAEAIMRREPVPMSDTVKTKNAVTPGSVVSDIRRAGVANEYPHPLHTVSIGYGVGNTGVDYAKAKDAAKMQTLEEHNAALTAFIKPGMNEAQLADAIVKGKELESRMLSFWDDSKPREQYHPTSSAVQAVRLTPDGRIQVMWRHKSASGKPPKWYTYKTHANPQEASMSLRKLMTSGSIGKSVYPGRGWFAESEYDAAQATGHGATARQTNPGSSFGRRMPKAYRRRK